MGIELRIETPTEPQLVHDDGSDIEVYLFQAYHGEQSVGSLQVNRVRTTTNDTHRQIPLLFDRSGNSRMYQASLQVHTPSYKGVTVENRQAYDEVVAIGTALVSAGQTYCQERFGIALVASVDLQTTTERIVWNALSHGAARPGFVATIGTVPPIKYFNP